MSHSTRYLFLDFDGVTHRFFPQQGSDEEGNAYFAFVPAITKALEGLHFPVKIVISSTWRRTHSLEKLKEFLGPLGEMVVGSTPVIREGNREGGRLIEVRQWIEKNAPGAQWVALDDYPEMYSQPSDDEGWVALVHCPDCFTEKEAEMLRKALADPHEWALSNPTPRMG